MSDQTKRLLALLLLIFLSAGIGCSDDDDDDNDVIDDDAIDDDDQTPDDDDDTVDDDTGDDDTVDDDTSDDDTGDDDTGDDDTGDDDTFPDDIIDPPDEMPFFIERDQIGVAPTAQEIAAFTQTMKDFYESSDYFRWAWRMSPGLAEDNEWDEPGYQIWWTNAYAIKAGDTVTITWHNPPDNTTAKVGRVLPSAIGLYLATGDELARDLALGYIKGLSATYDGMVWGDENPVVDSIMARTVFHRNHTTELDGGRILAVDYDSVRFEEFARRHDTIHNPENPTWGDIWVRNKRSKDDLPYLYRNIPLLARLIRATDDDELKQAAIKLYRQIGAMGRDIVEHGYHIRTKGVDGEIYIPRLEIGIVDDFASLVNYEIFFPNAECTAKLNTAYVGYGEALENQCEHGMSTWYELIANYGHAWSANMIWGHHIAAVSLALSYGDYQAAYPLLVGLGERMDKIQASYFRQMYIEWDPEIAQTLVLAAAYGLPLTNKEARYIIEQFTAAAEHYGDFAYWDLWDGAIPDGDYEYLPDRYEYDGDAATDAHVRITEIIDLYEYCYSPLKDAAGAQFIDCDALLDIQ